MKRKSGFLTGAFGLVVVAGALLIVPARGYSQTGGQERRDSRQDARDANQQNREEGRAAKADCKAGDEKTRAECRKEKREVKNGGAPASGQGANPAQ